MINLVEQHWVLRTTNPDRTYHIKFLLSAGVWNISAGHRHMVHWVSKSFPEPTEENAREVLNEYLNHKKENPYDARRFT